MGLIENIKRCINAIAYGHTASRPLAAQSNAQASKGLSSTQASTQKAQSPSPSAPPSSAGNVGNGHSGNGTPGSQPPLTNNGQPTARASHSQCGGKSSRPNAGNAPKPHLGSSNTPKNVGGNWYNGESVPVPSSATVGAGENTITVYSPDHHPLELTGDDIQASGGEGTIFKLPEKQNILVKVYKGSLLNDKEKLGDILNRINDMMRISAVASMSCFAWPKMLVLDNRDATVGFAMNKCSGRSLLSLSGVSTINKNFPEWDRKQLVRVAINFMTELQFLTMNHVLVNDFNPLNFLVDASCNVSFIDCDSYQIPTPQGGVNVTNTYFASHVAPELVKDKQKLNRPRDVHHVEFGAALTVFNIIMCGLHPYTFRDPLRNSACGTPEENLLRGLSPLREGSGCTFPTGPWHNLWENIPVGLKTSLIQTFGEGHSNPCKRVPLGTLQSDLAKMEYAMRDNPQMRSLTPEGARRRAAAAGNRNRRPATPVMA